MITYLRIGLQSMCLLIMLNLALGCLPHYSWPACRAFSIPSRIRTDHGTENVDKQVGVAAFVNEPTPHFNADWQMRLPTILQTHKHWGITTN